MLAALFGAILIVNELVDTADSRIFTPVVAPPTVVVGVNITDFGAVPYGLLNVIVVSQVVGDPVPVITVNDPAESVEPAVTVAVAPVPQFSGVPAPIVGGLI